MKKASKSETLTTNEALEALLGRKAAKRLRQLAIQVAAEDQSDRKNSKGKGAKKR
jgi:hypothetical protein